MPKPLPPLLRPSYDALARNRQGAALKRRTPANRRRRAEPPDPANRFDQLSPPTTWSPCRAPDASTSIPHPYGLISIWFGRDSRAHPRHQTQHGRRSSRCRRSIRAQGSARPFDPRRRIIVTDGAVVNTGSFNSAPSAQSRELRPRAIAPSLSRPLIALATVAIPAFTQY